MDKQPTVDARMAQAKEFYRGVQSVLIIQGLTSRDVAKLFRVGKSIFKLLRDNFLPLYKPLSDKELGKFFVDDTKILHEALNQHQSDQDQEEMTKRGEEMPHWLGGSQVVALEKKNCGVTHPAFAIGQEWMNSLMNCFTVL